MLGAGERCANLIQDTRELTLGKKKTKPAAIGREGFPESNPGKVMMLRGSVVDGWGMLSMETLEVRWKRQCGRGKSNRYPRY